MPTLANAYVAVSATSPLQPGTVERREPGEFEVRIAIKFTGICHSDIHTARGDWASVKYPVVVGHRHALFSGGPGRRGLLRGFLP